MPSLRAIERVLLDPRLGTIGDRALAKLLRTSPNTVIEARRSKGLPPACYSRVDWSKVDLGSRPDTEIAAELKCSPRAVGKARAARGIPAFNARKGR